MPRLMEGDLVVRRADIAIVVSRFNSLFTERMLNAALATYARHGGDPDEVTVAYVPGAFELPVMALRLAESGRFDAVVTLGCVIKGETDHYGHGADQAASGIAQVSVRTGVPTVFGVITCDTLEQASERTGSKQGNQGESAMLAAVEMVNLFKRFEDPDML